MNFIGVLAISTLALVMFYGMATVQFFLYHARFRRRDSRVIRVVVVVVWLCSLGQLICVCSSLYTFTILEFFTPIHSVRIPPTLAIAFLLGGITQPLVQAALTFRMWKFTQAQSQLVCAYRIIPVICWSISVYILGATMFLSLMAIFTVHNGKTLYDYTETWRWMISSMLFATAVVDGLISLALCWQLFTHRGEAMRRTAKLLDKLILWTIPTGMVTSLTAVAVNIGFMLSRHNFTWLALLIVLTDLYTNTLLALLNGRWQLDTIDDDMTITTFRLSGSRPHSLRSGGPSRPPTRRQLRIMVSNDTLNTIPGRSSAIHNTYSNPTYFVSGGSPVLPTVDGGFGIGPFDPIDTLGSAATFYDRSPLASDHHGLESGSFEMVPLRTPQSARVSDSPRHGNRCM